MRDFNRKERKEMMERNDMSDDISLAGTIDILNSSFQAKTDPLERAALARALAILCDGEARIQMIRSGMPLEAIEATKRARKPYGFYRKRIMEAIGSMPARFTRAQLRDALYAMPGWTDGFASIQNAIHAEIKKGRLIRTGLGMFEKKKG